MNLAESKHEYDRIVADWQRAADAGVPVTPQRLTAVRKRLGAVRKSAMRAIDEYTSGRSLPINTRRGLVEKLERLHSLALTAMVIGE